MFYNNISNNIRYLLRRYSGSVDGTPQWTSSTCSSYSLLVHGKQPTESPIKIWARSNSRLKSYGPSELVL
jgi:hypothetical protein